MNRTNIKFSLIYAEVLEGLAEVSLLDDDKVVLPKHTVEALKECLEFVGKAASMRVHSFGGVKCGSYEHRSEELQEEASELLAKLKTVR